MFFGADVLEAEISNESDEYFLKLLAEVLLEAVSKLCDGTVSLFFQYHTMRRLS